jgi:hypothetical protein
MAATYDLALCTMVLLEHLDVRVVWEAVLTHRWEIGRLPARAIEVLFNLKSHLSPTKEEQGHQIKIVVLVLETGKQGSCSCDVCLLSTLVDPISGLHRHQDEV